MWTEINSSIRANFSKQEREEEDERKNKKSEKRTILICLVSWVPKIGIYVCNTNPVLIPPNCLSIRIYFTSTDNGVSTKNFRYIIQLLNVPIFDGFSTEKWNDIFCIDRDSLTIEMFYGLYLVSTLSRWFWADLIWTCHLYRIEFVIRQHRGGHTPAL